MDLSVLRQRWSRMLAQASHFAKLDNTTDAVARARLCEEEIDREIEGAPDSRTRAALAGIRDWAAQQSRHIAELHRQWQVQVEARSKRFRRDEREAYRSSLPKDGTG